MSCIEIKTEDAFNKLKKGDEMVIVNFKADWCPPCKTIKKAFKDMPTDYPGIIFAILDVDNVNVAKCSINERVKSMPTFIVYKNGNEVKRVIGANEVKVREMLDKLSSSHHPQK